MNFNAHTYLEGKHAFLSPSKYHWIRYDQEKLEIVYERDQAKKRGTKLHDLAAQLIDLGIKQARSNKTFNKYINDAIGFRMKTEQPLFYSLNCFGHVDAISFNKNKLRIHDLKTGTSKASFDQLLVYTALFCLEYKVNPNDIEVELRIYQNNEVFILEPEKEDILYVMETIIEFDKWIEGNKEGV